MIKLVDQGFRVVAPNQRGYSPEARPLGYQNYQMRILAKDIIELAKQIGFTNSFHLVGHDMGALVGWTIVTLYPHLIKSWTALIHMPQINYSPIKVPTKLIGGNKDLAVARSGIEKNNEYVSGPYELAELDAGHWLMEFNQAKVCKEITNHIQKYK